MTRETPTPLRPQPQLTGALPQPSGRAGPRPYTRCQGCGKRYPGARRRARCDDCQDGQQLLWDRATAPEGFEPVA